MNLDSLEKSVGKTLLWRRLGLGLALLVLSGLVVSGILLWQHLRMPDFAIPEYSLDPASETYWRDRTLADLEIVSQNETPKQRERQCHFLLTATLRAAQKLPSEYRRVMALSDIALTLAQNDENLNIDEQLQSLGKSPTGSSRLARVLVSQALMNLRNGNRAAARVKIQDYLALVQEADIKLDSDDHLLSFIGAVTALAVMEDRALLAEMFQRQSHFALRVPASLKAKAFRTIAGEQARVGLAPHALNLARSIDNPVELVRAYQLIISRIARPEKIRPTEPMLQDLVPFEPSDNRQPPPVSASVTLSVVNEVLRHIAKNESFDTQINLLLRLAGSRLMCDSEIYTFFLSAVEQADFDELVKRPVLKLLREPESDAIRAALGMAPVERKQKRNVDPALDDWSSSEAPLSVDLIDIAPETLKALHAVQTLRTQNATALAYLTVTRHRDAANILQEAVTVAQNLTSPRDKVAWLLTLGEKQLSAGDSAAARETLLTVDGSLLTSEQYSSLTRLQVVGKFYDDALKTLTSMESDRESDALRNDDLVFLARAQIEARLFDDAQQTVSKIMPAARKNVLQNVLALGRGESTETYAALAIPDPNAQENDASLLRCYELLLQQGLHERAAQAVERMKDPTRRFTLLHRLARENMLLFRAHRLSNELHARIRETLLENACRLAANMEDSARRAALRESILADAIPFATDGTQQRFLTELCEQTLQDCRGISETEEVKAGLLASVLLKKIELDPSVPFDERESLVQETIHAVNQTKEGLQKGIALSRLAEALALSKKNQTARKMIEDAGAAAHFPVPPQEAVSLLLSLIPTLELLSDVDSVRAVYDEAFEIVSKAFPDAPTTQEKEYQERQRDSEFDRLVRHQLEYGFLELALECSARIRENRLRERLLRSAAYIYLDQGDFERAESTIRLTTLPDITDNALRDILFMQRQNRKEPEAQ